VWRSACRWESVSVFTSGLAEHLKERKRVFWGGREAKERGTCRHGSVK